MESDDEQSSRMARIISRIAEIEEMSGQEMPQREIFALKLEHTHLSLVVADSECKRLARKVSEYEHRDRVLAAFDVMERDDLKAFRDKKHATELSGRKRL